MEISPDRRRTMFVISIWADMIPGKESAWRGSIRTIDGQRVSFNTLAGLNRILSELSDWHDPPIDSIDDLLSE